MLTCSNCGHENPDGAKFCMECAKPLGAGVPAQETRKIVTTLFCDLVGSTSLGENHDPEILRPILGSYLDEVRSAAERHGGLVEKFIGDAVVAVFPRWRSWQLTHRDSLGLPWKAGSRQSLHRRSRLVPAADLLTAPWPDRVNQSWVA